MASSATVHLLFRFAELAKRYGLRPSEADANFLFKGSEDGRPASYSITINGMPADHEKFGRYLKMCTALGCDEDGDLKVGSFDELEDRIEHALSKAPRQFSL